MSKSTYYSSQVMIRLKNGSRVNRVSNDPAYFACLVLAVSTFFTNFRKISQLLYDQFPFWQQVPLKKQTDSSVHQCFRSNIFQRSFGSSTRFILWRKITWPTFFKSTLNFSIVHSVLSWSLVYVEYSFCSIITTFNTGWIHVYAKQITKGNTFEKMFFEMWQAMDKVMPETKIGNSILPIIFGKN